MDTISLIVSLVSLAIMLWVAWQQTKQIRTLEKKVFGTLPDFQRVELRLIEILEKAEEDPDSVVYFMFYWLWFGADMRVPERTISSLDRTSSKIACLLQRRMADNKMTHVVVLDPAKPRIKQFLRALFEHRLREIKHATTTVTQEEVDAVLANYIKDVGMILNNSVSDTKFKLRCVEDIPTLTFAVHGKTQAAVHYLGETLSLEVDAMTGGFTSDDPTMVDVFKSHVCAVGGWTKGDGTGSKVPPTLPPPPPAPVGG